MLLFHLADFLYILAIICHTPLASPNLFDHAANLVFLFDVAILIHYGLHELVFLHLGIPLDLLVVLLHIFGGIFPFFLSGPVQVVTLGKLDFMVFLQSVRFYEFFSH